MKEKISTKKEKLVTPPLWLSLIPLIVTALVLGYSVFVLDTQPHFSLFIGAVTAGLCAYFHGVSWETIKEGFKKSISRTIPSLFILIIIGMLIGVWIASGIVPAIMYLGLKFLVARWFLPLILLFCSAMALITGSSWSTIGTIGVAAIGIGEALGIPQAMTAGAVVSGAFFGDKMSPMSDSTNLTPSVLGVNLFDHIKNMLYTTLPGLLISLVAFTFIGFTVTGNGGVSNVSMYTDYIQQHFNITPWLFIPPLAVILMIAMKIPAISSLIVGVVLGGAAYILFQGGSLGEYSDIIHTGVKMDTLNSKMDMLFSRGGIESMYSVVILTLISLALGGIMNHTGMLHSIVLKISGLLKSVGSLTATVIGTSVFVNIITANQYLAVIIPGQMFEESYRNHKLKLKNLTSALEAGGTLTAPLIPWNSNAVFVFLTLGVPVVKLAPYAILCWITPIIVIVFAFFNIKMERTKTPDEEPDDQQ
ncbi:MAG: Na+/H+ antiporter NhaC [Candidatus Methanofastidiosum sp.]|nr:Na+/H+ antiporter NhaC [Methanofastidiosum sp.]